MISFAPYRGQPEVRESYTDQVVQAAVQSAAGSAASSLTATVEAIARLWEFGFAAGVSEALAPWQLALAGRGLILKGEVVFWKSRGSGLLPVSSHDVNGQSAFPGRWSYRVSLPAPNGTISRNAAADHVLHARIGATFTQPWRGCSPLASSKATREVLDRVERSLSDEHNGPLAKVIGVPDPTAQTEAANQIGNAAGKVVLVEATEMDLPGEGHAARTPWKPNRVGPEPNPGTIQTREGIERSLLAAGGVPVELVNPHAGRDARESWRRFLWATISPAAAIVSAELRRLGLPSEIDFSRLNASDLAGRARAFGQLTTAGVSEDEAKALTGLE